MFYLGDDVLVLLPIPANSELTGFDTVVKSVQRKVGDRDYIVATPDHQRRLSVSCECAEILL